nr:GtrA family protein [uncultured Hyphomonas sp.]
MMTRDRFQTATRIMRFGIVGVAATLTHALVLWLAVEFGGIRPTFATLLGFFTAFCVSYLGHYNFTFRSSEPHSKALPAFAFAAGTGAILNALIFSIMTDVFSAPYWHAFAVTIVMVPPVVYILSRSLAFAPDRSATSRPRDWKPWLIPAVMFAMTGLYTAIFHYQVPYFDHWDIVPLYAAAQSGTLTLADLFRQHGSHWHASGYLVMLATADMSHMSHWIDPLISVAIAGVGFLALSNILRRALDAFDASRYLTLALGIAAFVYFSLDQAANWLWGWQVAVFICTTGVLWTIDLLSRPNLTVPQTLVAAAATAVAIYGFATAWTLLPIGFALICLHPQAGWRMKGMALSIWGALSAALLWHYMLTRTGYAEDMLSSRPLGDAVLGIVHYMANFMGSAFARISRPGAPWIAAIGMLCLIGVLIALVRRGWSSLLAMRGLLAMIAFAIGADFLTALGRWPTFGVEQAFANRYITFANYAWLGLILLAIPLSRRWNDRMRQAALAGLCLFVGAKCINDLSAGRNAMLAMRINAAAAELACQYPDIPPETRALISASTQEIDTGLQTLKSYEVSLFRPEKMKSCASPGTPASSTN